LTGGQLTGGQLTGGQCSVETRGKRHKFENIEETAFTDPTFFVLKICIPLQAVSCKNFGRFHQRKFMKITNKAIKTVKNTCLGIYNVRLNPIMLTEV